jgi:hypothetical protein
MMSTRVESVLSGELKVFKAVAYEEAKLRFILLLDPEEGAWHSADL